MSKKKQQSFEEVLQELEEIVEKLSGGDLPLDESIKLFEKGMKHKKFLSAKLGSAKNTVKKLVEEEGEFTEEDFQQ